jgi:hypothetical protein
MNRALVERIAAALLYEGYLLYPYRLSVKNRQRWTFGGLYPPAYAAAQKGFGSDTSAIQVQCLARGGADTRIQASARFLQIVARRVGAFDVALDDWPEDELPAYRHVESLQVAEGLVHSWQEAIEREIPLGDVELRDLISRPRWIEFSFTPHEESRPLRGPLGTIVGLVEHVQCRIAGGAELSAEVLGDDLVRVSVSVENRSPIDAASVDDRDRALLHALVSTHVILGVGHGEYLSLLDPPEPLRGLAAGCRNVGAWPVLVGAAGETDTMLASPIILYDYPEIAPESPGDLFDATEIDEILSLRILTLTDEEKRSVATLDARGRALLERTETLAREQLAGLHGTIRGLRPVAGGGRDAP